MIYAYIFGVMSFDELCFAALSGLGIHSDKEKKWNE